MAIYRNISISFWNDTKIVDEFTPEDKYFYLYLFTNPHTNLCGCYEISKRQVSLETGYSVDTIDRLFDRFEKIHGVIRFSPTSKEVLLLNWCKYNWTSSEKFRKPLLKEIESIKNKNFQKYLMNLFNSTDTVSIPYPYPIDTTVTDTVTDIYIPNNINNDINDNTNINKFVPPTVDEVKAYCQERQNNVDAETFVNFYESKGWMVGKNKMKSWKAAVRTWEKNDGRKNNGGGNTKRHTTTEYTDEELERFSDLV